MKKPFVIYPEIDRVLDGRAVWEPLGFRVTDYDGIRREVPRQLLELARTFKDQNSSRAGESMGDTPTGLGMGVECARVLRSLCASLLILPAKAPTICPVLNVEDISIPNAIVHFRKALSDRMGAPILHAPGYPNWELAASCFALALETEYRGPVYLGTTNSPNQTDIDLGVWNFNIDLSHLISDWNGYVEFCRRNDWTRDRALGLTPPGLV